MSIIAGIIIIGIGVFMTIKSEAFLNAFGRIGFFEQHLGFEGGSRLGYKLIGIFVVFIGTLILTGLIGGFIQWLLSPLINYSRME